MSFALGVDYLCSQLLKHTTHKLPNIISPNILIFIRVIPQMFYSDTDKIKTLDHQR